GPYPAQQRDAVAQINTAHQLQHGRLKAANSRSHEANRKLQKDRLITITIGKNNEPIQLQQKTLEAASEWFTVALKRHTFVEGDNGKLNFPEDCYDVWSLFVYWMINHDFAVQVKDEASLKLVQQCWIFGDKYDIKRFQNEAMLAFIRYFDGIDITVWSQERINATLDFCPSGSPLGRVVAEDLAQHIHSGRMTWDAISRFNMGHLWEEFCGALSKLKLHRYWSFSERLGKHGVQQANRPFWTAYLVGDPSMWEVGRRSQATYLPITTIYQITHSNTQPGMADSKPQVADLWKSLQTQDRLIKITIGTDGSPPIFIQQKTLESVAPWFANALKRDTFIEGQTGTLHFPADDQEAWKVLVYWIMNREVAIKVEGTTEAKANTLVLCAKCWALGDKYDIAVFQNEIMKIFLRHFHRNCACDLPREALNQILTICPPDSKLAELLAAEIVRDLGEQDIEWSTLRLLDVGHIWSSFCKAQEDRLDEYVDSADEFLSPTFMLCDGGRFMVGDKVMAEIEKA
ncbi:hypothetical protein AC578_3992, partial [Pseudocercospora eumusae]